MSDLLDLYRRSVEQFGTRVRSVEDHQWHLPTPDAEWDVHDLVNHLVNEELWAAPLLEGQTIDDVGTRFDGDLLGADPKASWESAARQAVDAVADPGVVSRTVHVSFGDITGEEYLAQLTCDHTIHAWDLARAIGADEVLDHGLVEFTFETMVPQVEQWRAAGVLGLEVEAPPDANLQTRLLALTGRTP